jgi:hypothetical protein
MVRPLQSRAVASLWPFGAYLFLLDVSRHARAAAALCAAWGFLVLASVNWNGRPAWVPARTVALPPSRWRSGVRWAGEESGAVLVVLSLAFVALMGFAALALDGSYAYLQQQRTQIAADAAVLGGVRHLALGHADSVIDATVGHLATANGATAATWSKTDAGQGLLVTAERTFPTFFAGILGYPTLTVRATAAASHASPAAVGNLLPMTVSCSSAAAYAVGEEHTFWEQESDAPGAFGWLDWDAGASSNMELADDIRSPQNSGSVWVGDTVYGNPGVKTSLPVADALSTWLNRPVTIPLYSAVVESGANVKYTICGFAQFTLLGYDFSGKDKSVTGRFEQAVVRGDIGDGSAPDFGVALIRLTQ